MRYTSAVVLSTIAVGQAAAASVHNRHASFHARREAAKRGENDVNWNALAYDLKDVKWDQVNWSSVFASTPAAKPTPTADKPVVQAAVTPTPEPKKDTPAPSSKPVDTPKPSPSKPASIGDIVSDVLNDVSTLADTIGIKVGINSKSSGASMYIGDGGKWGMDVTNTGSKPSLWVCWDKSDMYVEKSPAAITINVQPGKTAYVSFSDSASGACAPASAGVSTKTFSGLDETWAEFTIAGQYSTFDVSKNVNMNGRSVSMKGSKCTSDMSTCVFQCKDTSAKSCMTGYDLINCGANNGGGGGYDPIMQGVGGGCTMNPSGERLKVSFS